MRELNTQECLSAIGAYATESNDERTDAWGIIDPRLPLLISPPIVQPITEDPLGTPPGPATVTAPDGTVFYRQPGGWYY